MTETRQISDSGVIGSDEVMVSGRLSMSPTITSTLINSSEDYRQSLKELYGSTLVYETDGRTHAEAMAAIIDIIHEMVPTNGVLQQDTGPHTGTANTNGRKRGTKKAAVTDDGMRSSDVITDSTDDDWANPERW